MGSGKSGNTTQNQYSSTSGSPQAQAEANQVWGMASAAAANPFQQYSGQFVSPINQQQTTGISGINQAAGMYAPYGQAATQSLAPYYGQATQSLGQGLSAGQGLTGAGVGLTAANANLNPNSVANFMSPYIGNVVQATENQQNQQNQQQQSQLEGSAIQSGAFGGDRSGVAAANLAYQQNLANQPTIANLYNTGYQQALGAAQQQQQTGLQAGAQLGALGNQLYSQGLGGSQQYANLGSGLSSAYSNLGTTAQTNALNAAQAQVGAGTLQQQTGQAQDTALYNQFLQQQAYPFQTSQFLSNILSGTAPVYGSSTNATGTVSAPTSFFQRGGRVGRAAGGLSAGNDNDALAQILAAHGQMYAPMQVAVNSAPAAAGPYGSGLSASGGGGSHQAAAAPLINFQHPQQTKGGLSSAMQGVDQGVKFGENVSALYKGGKGLAVGTSSGTDAKGNPIPATGGAFGYGGKWGASNPNSAVPPGAAGGTPSAAIDPTAQGAASNVIYLDPNGVPVDTSSGLSSVPTAVDPNDYTGNYQRGGRVGLAYGGIPYADQINDPIVPADIADPMQASQTAASNLMRPSSQGLGSSSDSSSGSALSDVGQLVKIGSTIASFFNEGGRVHKDTGGGLSDPTSLAPDAPAADATFDKMLVAESGNKHFDDKGDVIISPKGAVGIAQVMPGTGPEAAKLAGVDWDAGRLQSDPDYNKKLGKAYYDDQKRKFGDPVVAAAAYNAGPAAVQSALDQARKNGGSYLDYLPKETQSYVGKVGGGNATQPGPSGLSAVATPAASGATAPQSWWDKESGGLSGTERAIVTALSGLGGMASSPSRFFGGALLSGLGAGANTYAGLAQKGMGLNIAQQQANTSQGQLGIAQTSKNIEVYNILRQQAGGYIRAGQPVPPQLKAQIDSLAASLPTGSGPPATPAPYSPSPVNQPAVSQQIPAPTNRVPVTAVPLQPPKEAPTPEATSPNIADADFRRKLGPARDPAVMRQKADELASIGDAQGAKDLMAQAQATEDRMMTTGKAIDANGNVIDVPGFAQQQAANTRIEPNQKWLDEQGTGALQRAQAREQLDVIKGVLENYESGSLNGMKAQAQALGKALGVQVPDTATMNAAAYEKFLKSTLRNVFSDVKDMGGRPLVSEIQGFEKATASPELQPEANKEILAQLYGKLNQQDKFYGDAATEMSKNKALDRGAFTNEWLKKDENKVAPMVEETKKNLAVRGATPSNPKDFKEGHTYIVDEGKFPGYPAGKYRAVRKDGKFGLEKVE